ncbi:MAG TPA: class I SAM-dependent methyltransferase [Steroidobacteraceae bacterium]|nr:class I SAM-dependent methyltransferase [Steroidobacteraceae bacterium]
MDLQQLYLNRFDETARARKAVVWDVLYRHVFQQWIRPTDTVLDLGAGFCEFINSARAGRRIAVDLNPDTARLAAPGVEVQACSATELGFLGPGAVDVVFSSNFLEHLSCKQDVASALSESMRVLRPGGTLILLGPNVRLIPGPYWDFFDHHVPLSDRSLCEVLSVTGFDLVRVEPRFLPYTTRSALPQAAWLVALYLRLRPLSSRFLGKQFLIVARKPSAAR